MALLSWGRLTSASNGAAQIDNVGPTDDNGWTEAHDAARQMLDDEYDWLTTIAVESVPEADAEPFQQGQARFGETGIPGQRIADAGDEARDEQRHGEQRRGDRAGEAAVQPLEQQRPGCAGGAAAARQHPQGQRDR